jgi:hypothetical protein
MKRVDLLKYLQLGADEPCCESDEHSPPHIYVRSVLVISSHLHLSLPSFPSLQDFQPDYSFNPKKT